ncbi:MAG: DegT/DnrJ/EryC1/StrS aminotransferase family protein [Spirochaetes bacterium]|nr:DegT/DnrJ/EryC1/StrS aminotransferase family protein [Spirochaetota bacterium]
MIPINKPTIVRKDLEQVLNCLITERIEEGELAHEFEKKLCALIGKRHGIAVNSFTSALHLTLLGLRIKKGDEIFIPAYSDISILNALHYIKASPILIDVEMDSYNMDFKKVKKKITPKTKAIILSHNFGIPADIDKFLELEIPVIEDCSYALGAEYHSENTNEKKYVGNFGLVSLFSFDTDGIITTGNGGMILTDSKELVQTIKGLKFNPRMFHEEYHLAFDYRMADISAALGLNQLKLLNKFIERRRELAFFYDNKFMKSKYKIYREITNRKNVYGKYTLLIESNIMRVIDFCRRNRMIVQRPIAFSVHRAFPDPDQYTNAEHLYRKLIQVPIYPALKKKEIETIAHNLLKVL